MTIQQESLSTEVAFLRTKVEELAVKSAELEEGKRSDEKVRRRLENDKSELERRLRDKELDLEDARTEARRELSDAESQWRNTVSEKDQLISAIRSDLKQAKDRLQVREQDLSRMNNVLQDRERQVKKAGDDHTSDRLSLVLEVERLSRDLAHYEADLDHAKSDLEKKEEELRQRSMEAATLVSARQDFPRSAVLTKYSCSGLPITTSLHNLRCRRRTASGCLISWTTLQSHFAMLKKSSAAGKTERER
jgi:chromosome segregation ATPase